jgi:hypothetical protein
MPNSRGNGCAISVAHFYYGSGELTNKSVTISSAPRQGEDTTPYQRYRFIR